MRKEAKWQASPALGREPPEGLSCRPGHQRPKAAVYELWLHFFGKLSCLFLSLLRAGFSLWEGLKTDCRLRCVLILFKNITLCHKNYKWGAAREHWTRSWPVWVAVLSLPLNSRITLGLSFLFCKMGTNIFVLLTSQGCEDRMAWRMCWKP